MNCVLAKLFFVFYLSFNGSWWTSTITHGSTVFPWRIIFIFLFIHIGRAIYYGSYFYNPNTWFSGIILFFLLMAIAFLGYILPFGQMSFWGATVITNLFSFLPYLIEWICGGYYIYNPTLKRFFLFHFILPFILLIILLFHIFYLHIYSSNNPLKININNKISFFSYIFIKDSYNFIFIISLYFIQIYYYFI